MPRFIQKVTLAALLIATANLFWPIVPAIIESLTPPVVSEPGADHFTLTECCCGGPSRQGMARFWIELLLLVTFFGSRAKGLTSTLLTIFGLASGVFIYLSWWRVVFRVSADAELPLNSIPHIAYLYGANVVDLLVAGLIAWLIALNLRHAIRIFLSPTPST